jgi:charged multivesicular body protein 5
MQDEMMDLMDVSNEIQETLGRSYNIPDDIDEEELMGGEALCLMVTLRYSLRPWYISPARVSRWSS